LYSSNTVFVFASTFTTNFFPPKSMSCRSRIARKPESGQPYSQNPNAVIQKTVGIITIHTSSVTFLSHKLHNAQHTINVL
jgi:hypothetical protein